MKIPEMQSEEMILFHDVHRFHRNAIFAALAQEGLQDVGQPKVLIVLDSLKEGAATQRELADAIRVSPATMSASLKSLERKGYVSKLADARDARCKKVVITQKGLDAVKRCSEAFDRVDAQLYAGFSPEEVAQLKGYWQRMLQNLTAIGGDRCPEGCPCPHPNPLGKEEST